MTTNTQIKNLIKGNRLGNDLDIQKIEVGYTNKTYSVDDKYIVKICSDTSNEQQCAREAELYSYFNGKLPVPKIIKFDDSKKLYNYSYMIYHKIKGDNLYDVWHTYSEAQRKSVIQQLCNMLKTISQTPRQALNNIFDEQESSWQDSLSNKISQSLKTIQAEHLLSDEVIGKISKYVKQNISVLAEQDVKLTYWDCHFDNILVSDSKIVGLLDFERTEFVSIDFTLDIVKRMVEYPKKYASAHAEQFIKAKDYQNLMQYFKDYYPELFDFNKLDTRLNIYDLERTLCSVIGWPKLRINKDIINKIVQ